MSLLYGINTLRLSAFGFVLFDIHQTWVNESLRCILSIVTHWPGLGKSCRIMPDYVLAKLASFSASWNPRSVLIGRVHILGIPDSHELPSSITIEPVGLKRSAIGSASFINQSR